MTLPLDVPTAKPPADLAPANPPAAPPDPVPPPDPVAQIADVVAPAIVAALQQADPHAYFATLLRTDPHLFYKWAAMLLGARKQGNATQNVVNVITAIPRSPLDELPKNFVING